MYDILVRTDDKFDWTVFRENVDEGEMMKTLYDECSFIFDTMMVKVEERT